MTALMLNIRIVGMLQPVQLRIVALLHALSSRHYDALGPADDVNLHQHNIVYPVNAVPKAFIYSKTPIDVPAASIRIELSLVMVAVFLVVS